VKAHHGGFYAGTMSDLRQEDQRLDDGPGENHRHQRHCDPQGVPGRQVRCRGGTMYEVKTYVKGYGVFVPCGKHFLCICSKEELDQATPEEVVEMIYQARQVELYMMMASGCARTIH